MTTTSSRKAATEASAERQRMMEHESGRHNWRRWGPYLSERQWGTVREDYSPWGNAWEYFPHDHARSRAYRWGEDGIAGFCDDWQHLCLSLALWNGRDPILKERLFGLTNSEGNHGEDVKELYYYLDATPTNSYLKMLYKYPQAAFPYTWLVEENRRRGVDEAEFELLDTGLFDQDRYFDVFVEYAKAAPEDILMLVTVHNRGPEAAQLLLLPQIFFRNTWSWDPDTPKPGLTADKGGIRVEHDALGDFRLDCDGEPTLLFCDNETNARRLFGQSDASGFFKDAFHEYLIAGNGAAVNPAQTGTKAGAFYELNLPAGGSQQVRLRLAPERRRQSSAPSKPDGRANRTPASPGKSRSSEPASPRQPFADFDVIFEQRRREADGFYAGLQHDIVDADARMVQRQAFAGLIWSKQFFHYNVPVWLRGDPAQPPPPPERKRGRNRDWAHLDCADVMSMPDKWEYPWFAAWDLAFHCIPLAVIDAGFAKSQLVLLGREWYMHPNGQLPAYEWAFGDVNPPVHAWAAMRVFQIDRKQRREANPRDPGDLAFLERVFQKLLLNFTWWVNRKDDQGNNIFQGGFLGLDNIGCFDRSAPLPTGGYINQADGTSWMAMYCLNLLRIAIELAQNDHVYEDIATKFFEHFLSIAAAINGVGEDALGLWDETDQFYYDDLSLPGGRNLPLKIHSIVGLIPLFAVQPLEPGMLDRLPEFSARLEWYLKHRPELAALVSHWAVTGFGDRRLLSLLRGHRIKALLRRMLDETRFLSEFGVRSVSKALEREPFRFEAGGATYEVDYWPGESRSGLFGGNSNWRGPIWMPLNYLLVESLQKFHYYYGDDFKVECPTGSGKFVTLNDVANELIRRLNRLFLKGPDGQRPVLKYHPKLATDPHFRDYVLFHEYFHGDTGRGVGASHQTGWTGVVAKLLQHGSEAGTFDALPTAADIAYSPTVTLKNS
jgi:Mannosylglycerate hydrolase MGH1-like glycoside hydrolase domain